MTENGAVDNAVRVDEERALWEQFVLRRDSAIRARLIQRYLGTVQHIAASLFARRPSDGLEYADYLQYGRVGLIEAVDRFDPARGAAFTTFAGYRIRGAILNGIESSTEHAAQSAYRRLAQQERVQSAQEAVVAEGQDDAFRMMVDMAIDLALGYLLEDSGVHRNEDESRDSDPYHACELKFLHERLKLIVEALPERERSIIKGHYYEHIDFSLLAVMLGISKGRVSQLHARSLRILRDAYRAMGKLDVTY
jgi:RNA polymerase sigma factor for flagellar operon FliA